LQQFPATGKEQAPFHHALVNLQDIKDAHQLMQATPIIGFIMAQKLSDANQMTVTLNGPE
jgi:hypothetical protein